MKYLELLESWSRQELSEMPNIDLECSDIRAIVKQAGSRNLFRGIKSAPPIFYENPGNRSPIDTTRDNQEQLDQCLKASGFVALRSNSMFCTSDFDVAESYGELYRVYPLNGFKYTWNKKAYDLFSSNVLEEIKEDAQAEKITEFFNELPNYRDATIDQAPELSNRILTKVKDKFFEQYFYNLRTKNKTPARTAYNIIRTNFSSSRGYGDCIKTPEEEKLVQDGFIWKLTALIKQLVSQLGKLPFNGVDCRKHGFMDTNIVDALKFGAEIYVSGPYYAVMDSLITKRIH